MQKLIEQIMKSSPLSRIIVSVSTVILLGLAAYNWAVSPQTTYLHASQRYDAMKDTLQKKALILRKSVAVKKRKLNAINEEITGLRSNFFTLSQSSEFFSGLENLADISGCKIEMMTFKAADCRSADGSEMDQVRFTERCASMEFAGGYGQIIGFLKTITDCPKRLSLEGLAIKPSEGDGRLICNMDITVYISEGKELIPDESI